MRCAICYHFYNLKNMKNTHGGLLLLVKLQAFCYNLLIVTLLHGCFSRFLNCTSGTKSRNTSHLRLTTGIFLTCSTFFLKLTQSWPLLPFYTPCKHQRTFCFVAFSGGIKQKLQSCICLVEKANQRNHNRFKMLKLTTIQYKMELYDNTNSQSDEICQKDTCFLQLSILLSDRLGSKLIPI